MQLFKAAPPRHTRYRLLTLMSSSIFSSDPPPPIRAPGSPVPAPPSVRMSEPRSMEFPGFGGPRDQANIAEALARRERGDDNATPDPNVNPHANPAGQSGH